VTRAFRGDERTLPRGGRRRPPALDPQRRRPRLRAARDGQGAQGPASVWRCAASSWRPTAARSQRPPSPRGGTAVPAVAPQRPGLLHPLRLPIGLAPRLKQSPSHSLYSEKGGRERPPPSTPTSRTRLRSLPPEPPAKKRCRAEGPRQAPIGAPARARASPPSCRFYTNRRLRRRATRTVRARSKTLRVPLGNEPLELQPP
jgi:hypothetical protein